MKQKCDGEMWDWFSLRSRRIMKWRPGQAKKIKKRANKQVRAKSRRDIEGEL